MLIGVVAGMGKGSEWYRLEKMEVRRHGVVIFILTSEFRLQFRQWGGFVDVQTACCHL